MTYPNTLPDLHGERFAGLSRVTRAYWAEWFQARGIDVAADPARAARFIENLERDIGNAIAEALGSEGRE